MSAGNLLQQDSEDQPWEAGPGSQVSQDLSVAETLQKLCAIGDVPLPDIVERTGADQVFNALPPGQRRNEPIQHRRRFT